MAIAGIDAGAALDQRGQRLRVTRFDRLLERCVHAASPALGASLRRMRRSSRSFAAYRRAVAGAHRRSPARTLR
jgi:hypothetical protein